MPRNGMTSVFRIDGLATSEIRTLGEAHLTKPKPIAHTVSSASTVLNIGLTFDPNNDPERHADIIGWPSAKEKQKLLAMKIAEDASVTRYPQETR